VANLSLAARGGVTARLGAFDLPLSDVPNVELDNRVAREERRDRFEIGELRLRRAGKEVRMVIDHTDQFAPLTKPDPSLVKAIVKAH